MEKIIKTKRLILRPLCLNDAQAVYDYSGNRDNTKYVTGLPSCNIEEVREYLSWITDEWNHDSPKYYGFAVILGDRLIGEIAIGGERGADEVSIGWIIHWDFWNCGYATEAATAIIDLCFNTMGINKITAACDIDNVASRRIMKKLGMKLLNENEPWEYNDGRISKSASYVLTKHS